MKKILMLLLMASNLCFGQNSYPTNGTAILNSSTDQALILKDGRSGTNWNYIEWQFSNGTRDWTLGRRTSTGYFTLWRDGANAVLTAANNGNVGIGLGDPRERLSVEGNISVPVQSSFGYLPSEDKFQYNGSYYVGNYSLGWYNDPWGNGAPAGYLSAFGGLKIFTHGVAEMVVTNSGRVGIGTTDPNEKLAIEGNVSMLLQTSMGYKPSQDKFVHNGNNVGNYSLGWYNDSWVTGAPSGYLSAFGGLKVFTGGQPRLVVTNPGNVGIGTTTPDAMLTVNGNIHTKEVTVDMNISTGPDYVFEKDYNLLSLTELEAYIKANKHLPEVPSAKEMEADGLNLKEMNLILLKKVEELTLHLIEANKRIEETDQKMKVLEKKVARSQK